MVRDLIIDIKEHDLLFEDKSTLSVPIFDSFWGDIFDEDKELDILICNIIIPEDYWRVVEFTNSEFICRFKASYKPDTRNFRIRLVGLKDGEYGLFSNIRGKFGTVVNSYAISKNIAAPISACMLPFVDIDGEYAIRIIQNEQSEVLDKAYIYSGKSSDIEVNFSDDQSAQLLSLCAPGNYFRYPFTGIGVTGYLNRIIEYSDLEEVIKNQFAGDGKTVQTAEFDNTTGKLDVLFSPEIEEEDTDLLDIDELDKNFFDAFTDEYVRRNIVLNELSDMDFVLLFNSYPSILGIYLFTDKTTSVNRIVDTVKPGAFDAEGNIIDSDEYFIVSATLEPNSIIMFDDEGENDIKDAPVFIIDDVDESRLYTSLIEQPYWVTESCHKCFILKKRSIVRYMIRQTAFNNDKGLYLVPQISSNLKNIVGLVQDSNTGRLLGLVSNNTNISDITLDEITQYIYATQLNQ